MKYWLALLAALVFNAAANLMMKVGAQSVQDGGGLLRNGVAGALRAVVANPILLVGLFFFAANAAFYVFALQSKTLKISMAYPVMVGGGFAIIALVARFHPALAERLTWTQWAGVGCVLLGIILISTAGLGAPSARN